MYKETFFKVQSQNYLKFIFGLRKVPKLVNLFFLFEKQFNFYCYLNNNINILFKNDKHMFILFSISCLIIGIGIL